MFLKNQLFEVKIPVNEIPRSAMVELSQKYHGHKLSSILETGIGVWSNTTNPWMKWNTGKYVTEGKVYQGNWTTRIAKRFYDVYDEKLDDKTLSEVGGFLGRFQKEVDTAFQISPIFDWSPGDFAERDGSSCWWAGSNSCRVGLAARENAFVVLFYKNRKMYEENEGRKGIGRSWMLEYPDKAFIFNAYGVSLSDTANILATQFKLNQKKVYIRSSGAFLNQGNLNNTERQGGETGISYVLAPDVSGYSSSFETPIRIESFSTNPATCTNCKSAHRPSELTLIHNEVLCYTCMSEKYPTCNFCERRVDSVTAIWASGRERKICKTCMRRNGITPETHTCSVHGLSITSSKKAWHTNRKYCDECLNTGAAIRCYSCTTVVDRYVKLEIPDDGKTLGHRRLVGEHICIPCSKKLITAIKESKHGNGYE
jgi:hypothetical protein